MNSLKAPQTESSSAPAVDPVREVGMANFMAEVIEASQTKLVIVDFWAPWCGPCKQLGPLLEKIVRDQNGGVLLAKIDIDQNPQIAQQMRIQSIPAVFAFFQGQPVDGFMGALPESQVKEWIEKLMKATGGALGGQDQNWIADALAQAETFLAEGDVANAHAVFSEVWERNPDNAVSYAGIMRCLLAEKKTEDAKKMLDQASPEMAKETALEAVRAAIELAEQAKGAASSLDALQDKLAKNPNDHQARFDLALAAYAADRRQEAVDALLEIVRRDRKWNDEAARKQLLKLFEAFGPMDPLTIETRKRLSSILFS
jgi:putative thioredoxin